MSEQFDGWLKLLSPSDYRLPNPCHKSDEAMIKNGSYVLVEDITHPQKPQEKLPKGLLLVHTGNWQGRRQYQVTIDTWNFTISVEKNGKVDRCIQPRSKQ